MRVLLDTNIIVHREGHRATNSDVGHLFHWLDRLGFEKCVHQHTINELNKFQNKQLNESMSVKVNSYSTLKTTAPMHDDIREVCSSLDNNENDLIDSELLNEVYQGRVDYLITEDRKMHRKAASLGIKHKIYTIDSFLEKTVAENPEQPDYKVLAVRKEYFGNIDLADPFFQSFKEDYGEFADWFNKKSDNIAYICFSETGRVLAFLYLKVEDAKEAYNDISPPFNPAKRLKVGTFKVSMNGFKLGERFLKIIFDNALLYSVDEIYLTIFNKTPEQNRLSLMMEDWGFKRYGKKNTPNGEELVYVRAFNIYNPDNPPRFNFPFIDSNADKYICPIHPAYHTELFPDSILNNESPSDYVDNKPTRNALAKVYISRSIERNLKRGDIIVFYRTASGGSGHYTSVATTLAVVERVVDNFVQFDDFKNACRKRTVFTDDELLEHWDYNKRNRPFVVNFLYTYSLPRRPNLKTLKDENIIREAPRGFERMSDQAFLELMRISDADQSIIID